MNIRTTPQIPGGIPQRQDYLRLPSMREFRVMEEFSNSFLAMNRDILEGYAKRWVADPLHQWSRLWEYPYCVAKARDLGTRLGRRNLRILDAGSGATFMPYYLAAQLSGAQVDCLDADDSLDEIHREINARASLAVRFKAGNLSSSGYESLRFDFIYCISVLEHTRNQEAILDEFVRLLKPGGMCVVTFDISLDGRAEISPADADRLIELLHDRFTPLDFSSSAVTDGIHTSDMVTPAYAKSTGLAQIPWRDSALRRLLLSGVARLGGRNYPPPFTFFCGTVMQREQTR